MADILGRRTNKADVGNSLYLNSVIGNKTVTSLNKLNGSLTLSDAAFTENEDTLALERDKNRQACYSSSKIKL